jgi:fumarate hydratase class II
MDFSASAGALWGPSTSRAVDAFPVSGLPMPPAFLRILALIKRCAAQTSEHLGQLDPVKAKAIIRAAQEIADGSYLDQFPVDVYQTGSGTSTNMNSNEVIAALSRDYLPAGVTVHPIDDVNKGQSSNDVIPTAMQIAMALALVTDVKPALGELGAALSAKAEEFWPVIKLGRTHLQDATPIRLGQEFAGYAAQVRRCVRLADQAVRDLAVVPLGGTAVGTGMNTDARFAGAVCGRLSAALGLEITETPDHFSAQNTLDIVLSAHGCVKTIALSLWKIASDIRLLGTGPRAGLGELVLPESGVESSIMPGKSPPAIVESLTMVVARVLGNDTVVSFAQTGSILELNVMMPVTIAATLESCQLLASATANFSRRCVAGLTATSRGPQNVETGLMLVTALTPIVGYEKAAALSAEAGATGEDVRSVARRHGFAPDQLERLLDPYEMTRPNGSAQDSGTPAPS